MRPFRTLLALALVLPVPAVFAAPTPKPTPAEVAAEKAFHAGTALMDKEKPKEALVEFQKALKLLPNEPAILWNAATAAILSHQPKLAATYFERDAKLEPLNGQVYARLMQAYQQLNDLPHRDAARTKLFAIRKKGNDESGYTEKDRFCRDMFEVGSNWVYAYEKFELKPRKDSLVLAPRYIFMIGKKDQDKPYMHVETGWDSVESDGKNGYRPATENNSFYFDAYYETGPYSRKTFGYFFLPEKPYEDVKKRVIDIINGKVEMTSGRERSQGGRGD